MFELIGYLLLFGLIGLLIGQKKGMHPALGFLGGAVLGPLCFLMLLISQEGKKCPECAETVKKEAKKCKHCGADLTQEKAIEIPTVPDEVTKEEMKSNQERGMFRSLK